LVWLRKTIEIPADFVKDKDVNLSLGMVQDQDITYLNGIEVGRSNAPGKRIYKIPVAAIKPGKNVIAIRYLCQYGYEKIGLPGDKPTLCNKDSTLNIPLTGDWKYNYDIEPALPWGVAYQNLPSALFNAMIAPVVPYGIRGILWYQGESNADKFTAYKTLQPMLFTDWRMRWGNNKLPFLFVQLPNLKSGVNWPFMREAQAASLNYPYTGMAVSIDVGNPDDVHPKNKDMIALRLYLQARKIAYGDSSMVYIGPVFKSMAAKGDTLYLTFNHTGGGLKSAGELKGFTVAGPDKVFHDVRAVIKGDKILIKYEDAGVSKPAVRYAWAPGPDCNLYNTEGLPAAPFRTDNW
jgi:sialate O-acetylesterase